MIFVKVKSKSNIYFIQNTQLLFFIINIRIFTTKSVKERCDIDTGCIVVNNDLSFST